MRPSHPRHARALLLGALLAGCGSRRERPPLVVEDVPEPDVFRPVVRDAALDDGAREVPDVSAIDPCNAGPCQPRELCGEGPDGGVGNGNGLDDDCNGLVDDGCVCVQDQREECFPGPPDRRGVGVCRAGAALCTELQQWGSCVGGIGPSEEQCNGLDDDCDGDTDEGLEGCATGLACPGFESGRPLQDVRLDARTYDPTLRSVRWSVACPAHVSPCPMVPGATEPVLVYRPLQSGRYEVTAEVTRANGTTGRCRFPLYVSGGGLRVELDWDRKGGVNAPGVDLDLHVVPIEREQPAYTWFSQQDCYYRTCTAPGGRVSWARSASDLRFAPTSNATACAGAPPPYGALWREAGRCWNPRLDTDNVTCDPSLRDAQQPSFCFVENVNVDNPPEGVTFRLAVNFYRDHGTCASSDRADDVTNAHLFVYCNGIVRAELGDVDNGVVPFACAQNQSLGSGNWTWLAADVRFGTNACGLADCRVVPLRVRDGLYPQCDRIGPDDELCVRDERLFVRRAGGRPVDSELADSF